MKHTKLILILLIITAVLVCTRISNAGEFPEKFDPFEAAATDPAYLNHPIWAPGSVIVDFKNDTTMAEIDQLQRDLGISLDFTSQHAIDERFMRGDVGEERMQDILQTLRKNPAVEYAEPDYYYHTYEEVHAPVPNDPLYKYQWNFEKINVRKAWDHSTGKGVIVAVIDTGVAYKDSGHFHRVEDLNDTIFVKGYNFVDKNDLPLDDNAHGTHVAGTIAQSTNNGKGVAGIAYRAKIMPIKVLSGSGFGKVSDIADGIRFAADNGAKVINMSLGGPFPSLAMKAACSYAHSKGVVIICAAGNSRSTRPGYPAAFKECVSVSSTRFDDKLAPYSNRGPSITIAAPGGDTSVDQNGDGKPDGVMQNTIAMRNPEKEGYYIFQGTSMAAPHVAGVAALIAANGVSSNKEIIRILTKTARKNGLPLEEGYGAGIVDAHAAVIYAGGGFNWLKLAIALLVLIIILALLGSGIIKRIRRSVFFFLSWILGACGLFFLPKLFQVSFPGMSFLTRSVTEWDVLILGTGAHANPIFLSILIPFAIAVLLYKTKYQQAAAGFILGVAGNLTYHLFCSRADIQWIPGIFFDKAWLILNILVAFILIVVLLQPAEPTSPVTEPAAQSTLKEESKSREEEE